MINSCRCFPIRLLIKTLISFQTHKSAEQLLRLLTGHVAAAILGSEMDDFGQSGPNILFTGPGVFQIWTGCVCTALKTMFMFWFEWFTFLRCVTSSHEAWRENQASTLVSTLEWRARLNRRQVAAANNEINRSAWKDLKMNEILPWLK